MILKKDNRIEKDIFINIGKIKIVSFFNIWNFGACILEFI